MKKVMMTNFLCDNCGDCVRACMEVNKVSRIYIIEKDKKFVPIVCQHCASAPCKEVCPVNAIYHENSVVKLDLDKCIGCGLCALACPFGAIVIDDKAYKCVLCKETACVKACSKGCLEIVEVNDIINLRKEKASELFVKIKVNGSKKGEIIDKIVANAKIQI
ncbi:4Fe-4S ferredoxin iron-sulfur binding domain protein [Methanocaldococcus villosus KIN24-T80]|uniref:Ferredoxin n=1 Tax=Methanocaldococcus villosus KIN24-T80 TaxID=1069083 RepID=N6V2L0_9EURY|nr:4Fe-4S dicluster domain-containing protein [Methanocaldococcus villosus]ENN96498.1 4Fe-4S ferredoxin iron-sulfur binding domain protein [Methanocaldococcus villosus KIN24-T80]